MTRRETRRGFLKIGATTVLTGTLVSLSGCSSIPGLGGGSAQPLNVVPAEVTAVAYADIGGMLEDSAVETLLNKVLELAAEERGYTGPEDKGDLLDQIEEQAGLDPTEMGEVIAFGKAPDVSDREPPSPAQQYGGTWFTTGWSEDEMVDLMRQRGTPLEEDEYENHTIYKPTSEFARTWMGVIQEGEFVMGTEDAVKETIDVAEGEMESVGSGLKDPYSSVRSGLFKVATTIPEDKLPDKPVRRGGVQVDPDRIAQVESGAAVVYHAGDQVGIKSAMRAKNGDTAKDVRDILAGAIATAENTVASEELAAELDAVSVTRNGQTVTIGYENAIDAVAQLIEVLTEEFRAMNRGDTTIGVPASLAIDRLL